MKFEVLKSSGDNLRDVREKGWKVKEETFIEKWGKAHSMIHRCFTTEITSLKDLLKFSKAFGPCELTAYTHLHGTDECPEPPEFRIEIQDEWRD